MIRGLFRVLPGPTWARAIQMTIILVVAVLLLVLFYEWVGDMFFDSGGAVG